jgi:hypothetical protein
MRTRFRVVYRLVGSVYLVLVARPGACLAALLRALQGCVRVLLAAARGVEVTPDKIAERYPEVPDFDFRGRLSSIRGREKETDCSSAPDCTAADVIQRRQRTVSPHAAATDVGSQQRAVSCPCSCSLSGRG